MQNICQRVIRCLCSCLIKKQQLTYSQVNDEKHKFISVNEHLQDQHRNQLYEEKQHSSDLSTQMSNKLSKYIENQLSVDANPSKKKELQHKELEPEQHEQEKLLNIAKEQQKDYTDIMNAEHPYYHLFKQKLALLSNIFQIPPDACTANPDTAYPLTLNCFQEGKTNVFKYFFTFPTDYETYEAISSDFELQKKFDPNIEEFKKVLETPEGDAKLVYLSYKKVLMMSSRDFQYVRFVFEKDGEYWNMCVSDLSREQVKGKVRGQMLLTVTRIVERDGGIDVSVSSQVDMKIPIKLQIAKNRGFAEIRKYLDKVYNHIKNDDKSIL